MIRRCTGEDPNLLQIVDAAGNRVERSTAETTHRPCDCRMTFDDARRQVIWPHPEL